MKQSSLVHMPSRPTICRLALFAISAALLLLFFARSTTPLTQGYFYDQTVFNTIGRKWLDGLIPYHDAFDHKGPLMYLIQIVAIMLAPGKYGLWLLETAAITISFDFLYRCGRTLGASRILNMLAMACGAIHFALTMESGNTVEVWSLPFQTLALLLGLRILTGKSRNVSVSAFVCGLCFGATAMIRINNNAIICGMCIALFYYFMRRRLYADMVRSILMFLSGCVAVILPFLFYFRANDALGDMLYANFGFNLIYKQKWCLPTCFHDYYMNGRAMAACFIAPIAALFYDRHRRQATIFPAALAMSAVTVAVFIKSPLYYHYFIMSMPVCVLCVQLTAPLPRYAKIIIPLLACMPLVEDTQIYLRENRTIILYTHRHGPEKYISPFVSVIERHVPPEERDSIYTLGSHTCAASVTATGHLPIGRFFYRQEAFVFLDGRIRNEIIEDFESTSPKWILSTTVLENIPELGRRAGDYILTDSCPGQPWYREAYLYRTR